MTNNYDYIIIDDEVKAIKLLSDAIGGLYDNMCLAGAFSTWESSLEALQNTTADIVFLDISMPHKSGFSLLEMVHERAYEIIFVTAHEEHALKAYKYAPVGYLLKPVNNARLRTAVDKALERVQHRRIVQDHHAENLDKQNNKLSIRNNSGLDYVNVDDIIFFEANARYTRVVTKLKSYVSSYNIGKFRQVIARKNFYSIHRSFIININYIKRYESSGVVIMENGDEIPVSKNLREDFLNLFNRV